MPLRHPMYSSDKLAQQMLAGITALDGSNPTSIAHGMKSVTSVTLTLQGSAAPGDNTSILTYVVNGDNVDVYAWKNTGGTDPTLVASTGTESFSYQIIGDAA